MRVEVFVDVGRVDDLGETGQRRVVIKVVLGEEDFEGAFAVAVAVFGAGGVEYGSVALFDRVAR